MSIIRVSEPALPPLDELMGAIREVWGGRGLTNNGCCVQQLEVALADYLGVSSVSVVSNGTSALILAMAGSGLQGEVITTPFTFVATAHAIRWAGLTPVFADIDAESMTLDPEAVERAITERTSAILAVHVYGRPCHVEALRDIADRHGLKLIFDAAQAFDVSDCNGSIMRHGDLSAMSFHATKVFHTIEGGALVCADPAVKARIDRMRNFGIASDVAVTELGLNAKLNELQAAVGLVNIRHMASWRALRHAAHEHYMARLGGHRGLTIPSFPVGYQNNHAYFPVLVNGQRGPARDALFAQLVAVGVHARRYFFPLLSTLPMYVGAASAAAANLATAHHVASQVLCLPMHTHLNPEQIDFVCAQLAESK
jgi:dTDP-4-amino-4,6-dideoxygalactose transaminase